MKTQKQHEYSMKVSLICMVLAIALMTFTAIKYGGKAEIDERHIELRKTQKQ